MINHGNGDNIDKSEDSIDRHIDANRTRNTSKRLSLQLEHLEQFMVHHHEQSYKDSLLEKDAADAKSIAEEGAEDEDSGSEKSDLSKKLLGAVVSIDGISMKEPQWMIAARGRLEYAATKRVEDFIVDDIIKEAVKLYTLPLRPTIIRVEVSARKSSSTKQSQNL